MYAHLTLGGCLFRFGGEPLSFLERAAKAPQRIFEPLDIPSRVAALGSARKGV